MSYFDTLYRKEWRELGFYYKHDSPTKVWTFVGDVNGLSRFCEILKQYTQEPSNKGQSEHIHLGPQEYLKIITWNVPFIGNDGIYGTFNDFIRLSDIFSKKISVGQNFTIDSDYSNANKARIDVIVKENGFDPSSLDSSIKDMTS